MTLAWIITLAVLLLIEILTVNFVVIWFIIGTVVAIIVSNFTNSLIWQLLAFVLVSTISFFLIKFLSGVFSRRKEVESKKKEK